MSRQEWERYLRNKERIPSLFKGAIKDEYFFKEPPVNGFPIEISLECGCHNRQLYNTQSTQQYTSLERRSNVVDIQAFYHQNMLDKFRHPQYTFSPEQ